MEDRFMTESTTLPTSDTRGLDFWSSDQLNENGSARPRHAGDQRQTSQVPEAERWAAMASGAIATLMGIRHRSIPGLLVAGAGAALLYHGYTGRPIIGRPLGADAEGDDVDGGGVLGLMPGQQRG